MITLRSKKKTIQQVLESNKIISVFINGKEINEGDDSLKTSDGILTLEQFAEKEKKDYYIDLLRNKYSEIENIIVLSGAGTSVEIGKTNKGLTMLGLWELFEKEDSKTLTSLITKTKHSKTERDLEVLLSKARLFNEVNIGELKNEILRVKQFIVEKCSLEIPPDSPHKKFLDKITLRPQKFPRVKIFTLNYDTLFEQAASESMFTVIDGFTFSNPREFNGKYFDYDIIETRHNRQDKKDSTIAKLFYLFKMHGSLSWERNGNRINQVASLIDIDKRVMVFPQDSKFEHTYEQPYFEMMARFQQSLRGENTLLISIGFSFVDKHISSVILESLKQNPSLNLMSFTFPTIVNEENDHQKELHKIAEHQSRVTLIGETFEVLAKCYPENIAHKRGDVLQELKEILNPKKS